MGFLILCTTHNMEETNVKIPIYKCVLFNHARWWLDYLGMYTMSTQLGLELRLELKKWISIPYFPPWDVCYTFPWYPQSLDS